MTTPADQYGMSKTMQIRKTITIDGPAASGKTTIGKMLADELGYLFFDTGVMYRAVTCASIDRDISIDDESEVTSLAEEIVIDIQPPSQDDGRESDVLADGVDITWAIRTPEVDANVSQVSAYRGVRNALSRQQRRIGKRGKIVMVGRDIGTVVLPEAEVKIYLDASVEERARRRHAERLQRGEDSSYEAILNAMKQRDLVDSTREVAPLRPADDAIVLDSDHLDADKVLAEIMTILKNSNPEHFSSL